MSIKTLHKLKNSLNKIGYNVKSSDVNYDDFFDTFIDSLNRSKNLQDATELCEIFNYVDKRFNKILKIVNRKPFLWNNLKISAKRMPLVSKSDSIGTFIIQNITNKKELILTSTNFEGCFYSFKYKSS